MAMNEQRIAPIRVLDNPVVNGMVDLAIQQLNTPT
jgi:hypothetical protein